MKEWNEYITPLLLILGCNCAGVLLEHFVLNRFIAAAKRTKWEADDILFVSLRGMIITWFTIGGIYLALPKLKFSEAVIIPAHKTLFIILIISASIFAGRVCSRLVKWKSGSSKIFPPTSIVSNIARVTVYAVGLLVILQTLGVSITPILTAMGIGALAAALALQDTLSNLFSGVHVVASRQIRIGDYIRLNTGEEGYVNDITWRNTIIRALSNNYIIVPNAKIASVILTNYSLPEKELAVLVDLGVSYTSDLEKVERITIDAGKEVLAHTQGGVKDFEPFIRYNDFGDSAIKFTVILRAQEFTDQYLLKHEFIKKLFEKYRENKIEIPFPVRRVILEKTS